MAIPNLALIEASVLVVLFVLSAFFSMSETALIGVNRLEVRRRAEAGDRRAKRVDLMLDDPERVLSTVLVGNTMVNITAAGLAAALAEFLFASYAHVIATVAVTLFILVVCELVPKTVAVRNPLRFALLLGPPLRRVESMLKPVIGLAAFLARAIVRPFGLKAARKAPYITQDEIEMLVRLGVEQGEVARFEQRVISDLFEFTETDVQKVMTPAAQVHWVPETATLQEAADLAGRSGRTRILAVAGDFDHVLGAVFSRDLLRFTDAELAAFPVTRALRPVLRVPHDLPADRLLVQMQREHRLLAVIHGADGRNVGIVTAEDLVEELVGEIHDEFDEAKPEHKPHRQIDADAPRSGPRQI
jgi:putative hemolysin